MSYRVQFTISDEQKIKLEEETVSMYTGENLNLNLNVLTVPKNADRSFFQFLKMKPTSTRYRSILTLLSKDIIQKVFFRIISKRETWNSFKKAGQTTLDSTSTPAHILRSMRRINSSNLRMLKKKKRAISSG